MALQIRKAERQQRKARLAIAGVSGGGKTKSALRIARGLAGEEGRILLGDTEKNSATLYADTTDFDHVDIEDYSYSTFMELIDLAEREGYDVLIIDSVSHAWQEFLDQHSKMQGNSFTNWSKLTPRYNELIQRITSFSGHIICTMRAKAKYEVDEKGKPQKIGLEAVMRPGSEYEFDIVGVIDINHNMAIEKTRLEFLADKIITKPSEALGEEIANYLASGKKKEAPKPKPKKAEKDSPDFLEPEDPSGFVRVSFDGVAADEKKLLQKIAKEAGFKPSRTYKCWLGDSLPDELGPYELLSFDDFDEPQETNSSQQ